MTATSEEVAAALDCDYNVGVFAGHGGWLTDGAIANCGKRAITASGDELAVVWDMVKGNCLNVLEGHSGEVRSVVLTRRGRLVPLSDP